MKKRLKIPFPLWFLIAAAALVALACMLQFVWLPAGWHLAAGGHVAAIAPVTGVRVSEIMTGNRTALSDEDGLYPDWVELYNAGETDADITGWTLTDNPNRKLQFSFPKQTLAPGACVVVFCSGRLQNEAGAPYHAPFGLSKQGDVLLLYDAAGAIMESVNIPAMGNNQVYARENSSGAFAVSDSYTPGAVNAAENRAGAGLSDSGIVVSELMAENVSTLKDESGEYADWIEIANIGAGPVSLLGYALSDDPQDLAKWRFPDVTIAPGQFLIVFASGTSRADGGELHAGFKLSGEGEILTLTDAVGRVASQINYGLMKADQSCSRQADGSYAKSLPPTPGKANQ